MGSPVLFDDEVWDSVSDNAKDFIKWLLTKDPDKRPTAQQVMNKKQSIGLLDRCGTHRNLTRIVEPVDRFRLYCNVTLPFLASEDVAGKMLAYSLEKAQRGSPTFSEARVEFQLAVLTRVLQQCRLVSSNKRISAQAVVS